MEQRANDGCKAFDFIATLCVLLLDRMATTNKAKRRSFRLM
uniref:Uncharacterized protein n=1 Tax=Anopheles dirus TaxID=7168 RepID=A0A182NWI0_9DIPT